MHSERHPSAGQTVIVNIDLDGSGPAEHKYTVEDWWDRLTGGSWMWADGNPAALAYAARSARFALPVNDEVVYGKINGLGHIVHVTELPVTEDTE